MKCNHLQIKQNKMQNIPRPLQLIQYPEDLKIIQISEHQYLKE
jgi:hypothetical protein